MTEGKGEMMGVCGLDCASCEIRRLPFDAVAAAKTVAWFRKEGWLEKSEGVEEALARSMYCQGCQGIGRCIGRPIVGFCNAAWTGSTFSPALNAAIFPAHA
jgi:hypothetical protein